MEERCRNIEDCQGTMPPPPPHSAGETLQVILIVTPNCLDLASCDNSDAKRSCAVTTHSMDLEVHPLLFNILEVRIYTEYD